VVLTHPAALARGTLVTARPTRRDEGARQEQTLGRAAGDNRCVAEPCRSTLDQQTGSWSQSIRQIQGIREADRRERSRMSADELQVAPVKRSQRSRTWHPRQNVLSPRRVGHERMCPAASSTEWPAHPSSWDELDGDREARLPSRPPAPRQGKPWSQPGSTGDIFGPSDGGRSLTRTADPARHESRPRAIGLTEADVAARLSIGRGYGRTGVSCRTQR
jgi:hypothetical protein